MNAHKEEKKIWFIQAGNSKHFIFGTDNNLWIYIF